MAIAFVKNVASGSANTATLPVTVPAGGVAAGNILICRGYSDSGSGLISSIADTGLNTYSEFVVNEITGDPVMMWKSLITTPLSPGNTITITFASKSDQGGCIDEFSGLMLTEDGENTAAGTGTSPSVSLTPTIAATLVVANLGIDSGFGGSFTPDADSAGGDTWHDLTAVDTTGNDTLRGAYKITTSAVSQTFNPTITSQDWALQIGALIQETVITGTVTRPSFRRHPKAKVRR